MINAVYRVVRFEWRIVLPPLATPLSRLGEKVDRDPDALHLDAGRVRR
jgi:hypothetical protein